MLFFHSARHSIAFPYQRELITFSRAAPTEAGKSLETVRSIVKRNETKGNESNSISTPIEQSSCTRLTGSDLGIAVSVFRVPGIHRRRMKREFSPRGELRWFFLDPRRFRRITALVSPHGTITRPCNLCRQMTAIYGWSNVAKWLPIGLCLARCRAESRGPRVQTRMHKSAKQPKETSGSWSAAVNVSLFVVENYSISSSSLSLSLSQPSCTLDSPLSGRLRVASPDNIVPQTWPQIETTLFEP